MRCVSSYQLESADKKEVPDLGDTIEISIDGQVQKYVVDKISVEQIAIDMYQGTVFVSPVAEYPVHSVL